ncbi:hypothetical protein KW803_02080 [Candidatus Saccharibacteria bacterium]|nr:hypothetical protein [Candidatus Saccharibacteria bacterium]
MKLLSSDNQLPQLTQHQWYILAVPAAVLFAMAIAQIISFTKFRDWLEELRIGWPAFVAVLIILFELIGAASLTKLRISRVIRFAGLSMALIVTGFWFVENLQIASSGGAGQLPSSGFFGDFLTQSPGWWTILEVTILLFWVTYAAELLRSRPKS